MMGQVDHCTVGMSDEATANAVQWPFAATLTAIIRIAAMSCHVPCVRRSISFLLSSPPAHHSTSHPCAALSLHRLSSFAARRPRS